MLLPVRRLSVFLASLTVAAILAACSPQAVASLLPASTLPLVTVTTRGGECPEGACGSTLVIERDGRLHQTAPQSFDVGQVTPEVLTLLDGAIKTADFAGIRSRPFTGECPVNFDGQEQIYEFGAPGGVERIASCETEIDPDHPLFQAVELALAVGGAMEGG
jgi:hypothetical protein